VDALIKIGAFLHYNGPATTNDVTNNGQEAFTILGPQSIMTDATVPNDIFETDPNGVKGLIRPITWVGRQPDTMKVATGDLSVPEFWTNKQHKYVDCDITQWHSSYIRKASMVDPNDQHNTLYGCVADVRIHGSALGKDIGVTDMATSPFETTYKMSNAQTEIAAGLGITIVDWKGRSVADPLSTPCPQFPPPGNALRIWLRDPESQNTIGVVRGGQTRTVYTPNEFFLIFNRPDDSGKIVPWSLQTDVNGGFKVQWDTKDAFSSFDISKSMCDSLGLNDYMWQEMMTNNTKQDDVYVTIRLGEEHIGDYAMEAFQQTNVLVNANTLFANDQSTVPITAVPASDTVAQAPVFGHPVYLADHSAVTVIRVFSTSHSISSSGRKKIYPQLLTDANGYQYYHYQELPSKCWLGNTQEVSVESWGTFSQINIVIPNLPFQPMLGSDTDQRILASLRIPFQYGTSNGPTGQVTSTEFPYYGDLLYNSDSSRSYLKITTDQQLYDVDVECRLIRRDGSFEIMTLPYKGQFQIKLRFLQTQ
jgi:hypothetical protein